MEADYIVVGTGSAGSVVVNRLSADPGSQVVVLEAGPPDKDKFIHIPLTWAVKLFRSAVDWDYMTEPQKELNGRQIYWPRGKMLGGSSSMNAQMWVRGFAADYDEWGELARRPVVVRPGGPLLRPHRGRAARHITATVPVQLDRSVARGGQGKRLPRRTTEYRCAGRLLPDDGDTTQRRAVELRRRVPETGSSAPQPHIAHGGHRHAGAVRWDPRRRGRIRARRSAASDAGASRGGAVRRCHQQPAAADALRHRGSRAARRTRHRLRAGRSSTRTRSSILCARSASALPQSTSTTSSHCQPTTRCAHCLTRCSPDTSHTSPTTSTGPSTKTPLRTSPPSRREHPFA